MSNLKLELVTIHLPLDVRIAEFKSDDEKMKDVNDFVNEIVEKAKLETENRREAEGKTKLDAFGLQKAQSESADIGRVVDSRLGGSGTLDERDGSDSQSDLWERESDSRSPQNETQNQEDENQGRLRWVNMEFQTQQVIENCTPDNLVVPSISTQSQNITVKPCNSPFRNESLSSVLFSACEIKSETERISPILYPFIEDHEDGIQSAKDESDVIETIPEVPSSQIEIEELLTQEGNIDRLTVNNSQLDPFTSALSTYSSSTFSTSSPSSTSTDQSVLHMTNISSNQKGKYVKDGFAQQAVKALRAQSNFRDIWRYEYEKNPGYGTDSSLDLWVQDIITEGGRCILVCADGRSTPADTCLVLAPLEMNGSERNQTANMLKGCHIRLFPPYSCKFIDYRGSFVCFYYNIVRWLGSNADSCCF